MKTADRVAEMSVFVRAVERGSFSGVARESGRTPSAVSKLISRLEDRLGVRLLQRTTRQLALTPEGQAFFERCQRILGEIDEAESEAREFRARPQGRLRMNVGVAFGRSALVPALPDFIARYPAVRLELLMTDRLVDLHDEGADLAVRIGDVTDTSLIVRPISELRRVICAAPAYLARHGIPRTPADLARHHCLELYGLPELQQWPFLCAGERQVVTVGGAVAVDNADALLQLAIEGVGLIRLTDLLVGAALRAGRLVPVLTDCHVVDPVPLYVTYPYVRHRSPRVTAMVDFLLDTFGHAPWRHAADAAE